MPKLSGWQDWKGNFNRNLHKRCKCQTEDAKTHGKKVFCVYIDKELSSLIYEFKMGQNKQCHKEWAENIVHRAKNASSSQPHLQQEQAKLKLRDAIFEKPINWQRQKKVGQSCWGIEDVSIYLNNLCGGIGQNIYENVKIWANNPTARNPTARNLTYVYTYTWYIFKDIHWSRVWNTRKIENNQYVYWLLTGYCLNI